MENNTSSINLEEVPMNKKESYRSKGSGSLSQNPSGTWKAQVLLPTASKTTGERPRIVRLTRSFVTRREAETWIHQQRTLIDGGLTSESHTLTLAQYGMQWIERKKLQVRTRTFEDYQRYCQKFIFPDLGKHTLRDLRPSVIRSYYVALVDRQVGIPTLTYIHRVLRAILSDAVRDEVIAVNPCRDASPPRTNKNRNVECMSWEESVEFLRIGDQTPYAMLYRVALSTGMRLGELLGLTWRAVDFNRGTIYVYQQIPTRCVTGEKREPVRPKTEAGIRLLPIGENLLRELKHYHDEQMEKASMGQPTLKNLVYVFPSKVGTPLEAGLVQKRAKKIFRQLGLPDSFTFHNLRHTAASLMLSNGMSLIEVSRYLGHSNPTITAQIYAHLTPGGLEKARGIQDALSRRTIPENAER